MYYQQWNQPYIRFYKTRLIKNLNVFFNDKGKNKNNKQWDRLPKIFFALIRNTQKNI